MCCMIIFLLNVIKYFIEIGIFKVVRFVNNLNGGSIFKMVVFSELKMNIGRKIFIFEIYYNVCILSLFVDFYLVNYYFF